jgi:hypothetical protein
MTLAIGYLPLSWLAQWLSGGKGVVATTIAAGLCFVGGQVALIIGHLLRPTPLRYFGSIAGMLPRMGIPLVFGLFFQRTFPPLAEAGLMLYLVAFHVVVLSLETTMSLPVLNQPSPPSTATPLRVSTPTR